MRLSDGVEWGVHVCVLLATLPDDAALPAAKLAEYHGVPAAYLAKHLQALAGAGVLQTVKGARGGYRLARPAAEVTVLEVVEAIDGDESAFRCSEIRRRGPLAMPAREYTKVCGIHGAFTRSCRPAVGTKFTAVARVSPQAVRAVSRATTRAAPAECFPAASARRAPVNDT